MLSTMQVLVANRRNLTVTVVFGILFMGAFLTHWSPRKTDDLQRLEKFIQDETQKPSSIRNGIAEEEVEGVLRNDGFSLPPRGNSGKTNAFPWERFDLPQGLDPDAAYRKAHPIWTYRCDQNKGCFRELLEKGEDPITPEVCWLTCGPYGSLWPFPTNKTKVGRSLSKFNAQAVSLEDSSISDDTIRTLLREMWGVFKNRLDSMESSKPRRGKRSLITENLVTVGVNITKPESKITLSSDESYSLVINCSISIPAIVQWVSEHEGEKTITCPEETNIKVLIKAPTIFGARHALETLAQLIAFDENQNCFKIVNQVEIKDDPVFPYRGLLLDTARNFIPIPDLKRVIDGMALNKLNMLHWHLTDSNAFTFFSKSVPEMTLYGAYSPEKVYYPNEIRDLKRYALIRGVKIIPELDAPAHAGNGWQWGPSKGLGNLSHCVDAEPWYMYCGQPPCGQLNPLNKNVYDILEKLYADFLQAFDNDVFHMGGDEVYSSCWLQENPEIAYLINNLTKPQPDIVTTNSKNVNFNYSYLHLWGDFQNEALRRLMKANNEDPIRPIVWTSAMTSSKPMRNKYLNASEYIIQIWDSNLNEVIQLLSDNHHLILSNQEATYLDHGGGTWLGSAHIYPYKNWQRFYDNDFLKSLHQYMLVDKRKRLILGGEATLWTEKVSSGNLDSRLWPRSAATAENLWSHPAVRSHFVYARLNNHNRRLIGYGIQSDPLQPESCYLNYGNCEDSQHPM